VNSENEQLTSLRNERKACHFWVDNEVADCYQPIVGADAIWVYCRIARNAHGAWIVSPKVRGGDTRVSLREMAEWCGKSVDTVWRCLQVLEHVGLLQAVHGARSKGRYALADVKDLVTREGGTYNREIGSFQLPTKRVNELKQQVRELRLKLARKSGLQLAVVGGQKEAAASVAQSDSLGNGLFAVPEAECDRTVAQSDATVALGATASITTKLNKAKQSTTPQPPQAGACDHPSDEDLSPGTPNDPKLPKEGEDDATKTKDCPASVAQDCVSTFQNQLATAASPVHHNAASRTELDRDGISPCSGSPTRGDSADLQCSGGVAGGEADLGEHDVTEFPFSEQQLAHLARYADDPVSRRDWEGYYQTQNRDEAEKAAKAAAAERADLERVERLKAELVTVPAARAWVMRQCKFVEGRRRASLGPVIEAALAQELEIGNPLWKTAPDMAEAWKSFQANGEFIDVHWGPVNFIKMGIWSDSRGWAWNEDKLERRRGARVGSAR